MGFRLLSERVKIHLLLCYTQLSQHHLLERALTPHRWPSTQSLHVFRTLLCSIVYSGYHFLPCCIISWIEILRTFHQISCRYSCFFSWCPPFCGVFCYGSLAALSRKFSFWYFVPPFCLLSSEEVLQNH